MPWRLALALGVSAAACAPAAGPAPPPPEAEAIAFVRRLAELAIAEDFAGLCALGSGNCESTLAELGEDSAPDEPPTVVDLRVIQPERIGTGAWMVGGTVLTVCGIDGLGQPYRSEVLVFDQGGSLRAIEAPFWWRGTVAEGQAVGAPVRLEGGC